MNRTVTSILHNTLIMRFTNFTVQQVWVLTLTIRHHCSCQGGSSVERCFWFPMLPQLCGPSGKSGFSSFEVECCIHVQRLTHTGLMFPVGFGVMIRYALFSATEGHTNLTSDVSWRLSLDLEPPMLTSDGEGLCAKSRSPDKKNMALFARIFTARVS